MMLASPERETTGPTERRFVDTLRIPPSRRLRASLTGCPVSSASSTIFVTDTLERSRLLRRNVPLARSFFTQGAHDNPTVHVSRTAFSGLPYQSSPVCKLRWELFHGNTFAFPQAYPSDAVDYRLLLLRPPDFFPTIGGTLCLSFIRLFSARIFPARPPEISLTDVRSSRH